ncbi:MAG TPA: type VI secretion system baseplate subunit TssF [Candidatus Angelobacter sp.]|nr:type VI secretion system baseplate subunit TssF [Candidatus Angelobacter sp.]
MTTVREDLLKYYERELQFLRQTGAEFAREHPSRARQLLLEPDRCEDPHVERLLEGFALLAARVHLKLDDDFPQISTAVLEALYPHYLRPVPSMTVVEFELHPEQGKPSTVLTIPRHSVLHSHRASGIQCRFRTAYETTVWPIELTKAEWIPAEEAGLSPASTQGAAAALKVSLQCLPDISFSALKIRSLRFYLAGGDSVVSNTLYELLLKNSAKSSSAFPMRLLSKIIVRDPEQKPGRSEISLPPSCLKPVGFGENEDIIPYSGRSFLGYRLLQEYFAFPEKFLFLDLEGLDQLSGIECGSKAEIIFLISPFERPERERLLESGVSGSTFRLGCTPIVNLFPQAAEPIAVDHTRFEHLVVPDRRRSKVMEVFSVDEVTAQNLRTREFEPFQPFHSFRHASAGLHNAVFWHTSRRSSEISDDLPTEVFLSLVDLAGNPVYPEAHAISVRCTCTNADLPSKLQVGLETGDFEPEGFSIGKIRALRRLTPTLRPPLGKSVLWNLISQLSLNYLSLTEDGKEALQEILRLYNFFDQIHLRNQINGITNISSKRHFALVRSGEGANLARGIRVEMELNEEQFSSGGAFLFSSIMEKFLGLYASMNSFSQLVVTTAQREEVLEEWPPRAGNSILM